MDAVPLDEYVRIMRAQELRRPDVRPEDMEQAFERVVLDSLLLDRLGVALGSARPMLVHGPSGAGKTFVAERLVRALRGDVLVPRAVSVDGEIVRIFDPRVHVALGEGPRGWMRVRRPLVRVGAEITPGALELHASRGVPLQLAAAGGVLVVDEIGRQRAPVAAIAAPLINAAERGTVPITLRSGRRVLVPFTARVVFASALSQAMIDQSGIRSSLGALIPIGALPEGQYAELVASVAFARDVTYVPSGIDRLLSLHRDSGRPLLAGTGAGVVHAIADLCRYRARTAALTPELVDWAWRERFGVVAPASSTSASASAPAGSTAGSAAGSTAMAGLPVRMSASARRKSIRLVPAPTASPD